jgi:hypothetical protein
VSGLADDENPETEGAEPEAPEPEQPEPDAERETPEPEAPEPEPTPEPESPPPPPREPSLQDIAAQIDAIPIGPFLLSFVSTLLSRAYGKLGSGDLDEARGAIDAIRALMPVIEGRVELEIKRDFDQALANLQVAYADASAKEAS